MADTIDIDDLTKALQEIATRSSKEVVDKIHKGIDRISRETLKEVKSLSPVHESTYPAGVKGRDKGDTGGKYQKGWITSTLDRNGMHRKTIHNKNYRLVHLLEQGHNLVNKDGEIYWRAEAHEHIAIAQQHAEEKVDSLIAEVTK